MNTRRVFWTGMIVILAVASFLRFSGLSYHGFVIFDEAHYMMEAKFWKSAWDERGALTTAAREGRLNGAFVAEKIEGLPPTFTPKPLHGFSIALFSMLTGHWKDWTGSLWSALCGVASVALLGVWAMRRFGAWTGLFAAALLAVCRLHVMYSRSQLAEADALLFALAATLVQFDAPKCRKKSMIAGVLFGIAIGFNYRAVLIPAVTLGLSLFTPRRRTIAWVAASIAGVMLVYELPYQIYFWMGGTLPDGMHSYLQNLQRWFIGGQVLDRPMEGGVAMGSFLKLHAKLIASFAWMDGWWLIAGAALGAWAVFKMTRGRGGEGANGRTGETARRGETAGRPPMRDGDDQTWVRISVAVLALIFLIVFSLVPRGDGPRAAMLSLPFLALLAAFGIFALIEKKVHESIHHRFGVWLLSVILIFGCINCFAETRVRSPWTEADRWLKQNRPDHVITTLPLAVRFYTTRATAELAPRSDMDDLKMFPPSPLRGEGGGEGIIWIIDTFHASTTYPYRSVAHVVKEYQPFMTIEGRVFPETGLFFDSILYRFPSWPKRIREPGLDTIRIYTVKPAAHG